MADWAFHGIGYDFQFHFGGAKVIFNFNFILRGVKVKFDLNFILGGAKMIFYFLSTLMGIPASKSHIMALTFSWKHKLFKAILLYYK